MTTTLHPSTRCVTVLRMGALVLACAATGCFQVSDSFGGTSDAVADDAALATEDSGDVESGDVESGDAGGSTGSDGESGGDTPVCDAANPPSLIMLEGRAFPRTAPQVQWGPPLPGCADTVDYELAVGTAPGEDDVMAFASLGVGSQWDGALPPATRLADGVELFVAVRAVDDAGNLSTALSSSAFQIWSPAELEDVALWIDYADPTTVFADTDCTVPAVVGDALGCVLDKSGNDNHVRSPQGSVGPRLERSVSAGLTAGRYVGDRVLQAEHSSTLAPGLAALTVAVLDAPMSVETTADGHGRYAVQKEDAFQLAYGDDNLFVAVETTASGLWAWRSSPTPTTAVPQLNVFEHDDTMWRFRRDGVELGETSPGNGQVGPIATSATPLRLGARIDGGNSSWGYDADQAEVVVISSILDAEEIADLERYLMEKWLGGAI